MTETTLIMCWLNRTFKASVVSECDTGRRLSLVDILLWRPTFWKLAKTPSKHSFTFYLRIA